MTPRSNSRSSTVSYTSTRAFIKQQRAVKERVEKQLKELRSNREIILEMNVIEVEAMRQIRSACRVRAPEKAS
jgi:hypothetical protein